MQFLRGNLTRIKSLINEKIPDGNDIFGYKGISKQLLVSTIDVAYNMSLEIKEDAEARFEVIYLKRIGANLYENIKNFLESNLPETEIKVKFNSFLTNLSSLIEKIKMTYFIIVKQGIRDEEELINIRNSISQLKALSSELTEEKETVLTELETLNESVKDIKNNSTASKEMCDAISKWHNTSGKQFKEIEGIHNSIAGWDTEIKEYNTQFKKLNEQIIGINSSANQTNEKLNGFAETGGKHVENLKKTSKEHQELLSEIQETLGDANRVGMAASFKDRKHELRLQQNIWQGIFVGAIIIIVIAVWKLVLPTITSATQSWGELAAELGIISPLIWLGWFSAKQYSYTSKIREDYAFKAAAAMAYEGHKKAARETDEELEKVLLEFSLFNMSQNPIRLYGDSDVYGTPVHELLAQLLNRFPHFKKATANIPSLGSVELSTENNVKENKREK